MTSSQAYLDISGPDSETRTVMLEDERVTIGRFAEENDLALDPDPQQLVGRHTHCLLERERGTWWIVDNGSVNGTFLQKGETLEQVQGRSTLSDGDIIRVLARLHEEGEPEYWELAFHDPAKTQPAAMAPLATCLEYDLPQARLYRVERDAKVEITDLSPHEHKLVRYMAHRNRANENVPVMCAYDELITAVWDEDAFGHTADDINGLVFHIRKKVGDPDLIKTVRGFGYRLATCG